MPKNVKNKCCFIEKTPESDTISLKLQYRTLCTIH